MHSLNLLRARRVSGYLSEHIKPNSSLLDIGCGDGLIAKHLEERLSIRATGADVVLQKRRHIPTIRCDGSELPFESKSFDTVMLIWVLHHSDDPGKLLAEAARISRNSVLVMEAYFITPLQKRILKAIDYIENKPIGVPVPLNFHTLCEWRTIFREAGLKEVSEHMHFSVHSIDPTKNVLFVLKPS
jgi:ubiquinone/menaquinone biosynthesis C-methylase UbiE